MKAFAELYASLDATNKTNEKVEALVSYFKTTPPRDSAWAVYFLIGRRIKRLVDGPRLWRWAMEESGVPEWLATECSSAVGDTAETIAQLLPSPSCSAGGSLSEWIENKLLPLRDLDDDGRKAILVDTWRQMDDRQRFVWNKLITGAFRVGVSQSLVTRAISEVSGVDANVIAHRLMGDWEPNEEFALRIVSPVSTDADVSRPYPFCLAYALEGDVTELGEIGEWLVEWKWDGIRSQLVRRDWQTFLWSRGEELITERFPEIASLGGVIGEGTVLDGEVLPWRDGAPMPFAQLQRRIGRKTLGPKILGEVPAALLVFDLLEWQGQDVREKPIEWRRDILQALVQRVNAPERLVLSPLQTYESWDQATELRRQARSRGVEGFMLKRRGSPYRVGRRRGDWWKWKIEPFSVDCVLIYAQRGSGRRASLYTDYTFGIWDGGTLVPFAKAYSGLTDQEIREVDAFVRRSTVERFGPVRTVKPELVFELAFEGIQKSTRHKSGIAVRFPRIARWRTDKKPDEADTLETVRALLSHAPPENESTD